MTDDLEKLHPDAVQLDLPRITCQLHGEPFRANWPRGWAVFTVRAFQEVTAIEGVWEEARRLMPEAERIALGDDPPSIRAIERVLDVRPACCRLTKAKLVSLFVECGVGVRGRCSICRARSLGAPYKTQTQYFPHLCFECVAGATTQDPRKS